MALVAVSVAFYAYAFSVGIELWHLAAYLLTCVILVGKKGWIASLLPLNDAKAWLMGLAIPATIMIPAGILLSANPTEEVLFTMQSFTLLVFLACGEEFAIRLSIARPLGNRFGVAFGIGFSALLFGLLHYPGSGSWMAVTLTTAGGVIYGISYFLGRSIIFPVALHILNNLCMELI